MENTRSSGTRALIFVVVLAAFVAGCGGEVASDSTTSSTSSTSSTSTTSTTIATTTTTTGPTTTTIPLGDLAADVSVFDDFSADEMIVGAACDTGTSVFSVISEGKALLVVDPNTNETLALGQLAAGEVRNELGPQGNLSDDVYELFWFCYFETQLNDVPLDRDFYIVSVEGDTRGGVTFDGASLKSRRYAGLRYFLTENEALRDSHR